MKKTIVVTGGCGYIGSHTIVDLQENDFEVICIDNNSNSSASVLEKVKAITKKNITFYQVDISDWTALQYVLKKHQNIEGIIHFAAYKAVGESVEKPLMYYDNNIIGLLNVLKALQQFDIPNLIFSSSCSVYGNADELPVTEITPIKDAESPYARTKQMGEDIIRDFTKANPTKKAILLRYFNPAGSHSSGIIGEDPSNKPSNLVPVITETAIGKRASMTVFGDDYDTRDGSCVRDYIHVMDLADAHTKCLTYLLEGKSDQNCEIFNVGIGTGATVLEAIHAFEEVSQTSLNYVIGPRRSGDVVAIYSNYDKAKEKLGWIPKRDIKDIMRTAWIWEQRKGSVVVNDTATEQ